MSLYERIIRPLLFRADAELMHRCAVTCARWAGHAPVTSALAAAYAVRDPRLETEVCGLRFPNPIGLAAGYDKNGRAARFLAALGFGHVEIGSVSADGSEGNPRPRLFRLPRDRAIVVHYGLPNAGARAVAAHLASVRLPVPLGINIVKTNRGIDAPPDRDDEIIDDYVRSVTALHARADYLMLNLSCPNTEMGRDFFADKHHVARLLARLSALEVRCPVFLKVSPQGGVCAIERLLEAAEGAPCVSGFAVNLPPGKPDTLTTPRRVWACMPGAVAGKPVEGLINACVRELYRRMDRERYRIIAAGGVFSAEDAYAKLRLGASLVQLLTAMVYEGPGVVKRINQGLCRLLERDGFDKVSQAVGADNPGP